MKKIIKQLRLITLQKLLSFAFAAVLLLMPFRVQFAVYEAVVFNGFANANAAFSIELFEVLLFVSVFLFALCLMFRLREIVLPNALHSKLLILMAAVSLLALLGVFVAQDKLLTLLWAFRFSLMTAFLFLLTQLILTKKHIVYVLIFALSFQAILAFLQFSFQASLGLHWLGEPLLLPDAFNVAKIALDGHNVIRPYGTFPHPNVLAAFGIFCLSMVLINKNILKKATYPLALMALFLIMFSFSRVAWFALALMFFVQLMYVRHLRQMLVIFLMLACTAFLAVVSGVLPLFVARLSDVFGSAFQERMMFFDHFAFILKAFPLGTGAGHYVIQLNAIVPWNQAFWLNQPVHNLFALAAAELSVLGALLFAFFFLVMLMHIMKNDASKSESMSAERLWKLAALMAIFILVNFDHFFYTLPQGMSILLLTAHMIGEANSDAEKT